MSHEAPSKAFEASIRNLAETADRNRDTMIDASEREAMEALTRLGDSLQTILNLPPHDPHRQALERVMQEVADEYPGLDEADIRCWIFGESATDATDAMSASPEFRLAFEQFRQLNADVGLDLSGEAIADYTRAYLAQPARLRLPIPAIARRLRAFADRLGSLDSLKTLSVVSRHLTLEAFSYLVQGSLNRFRRLRHQLRRRLEMVPMLLESSEDVLQRRLQTAQERLDRLSKNQQENYALLAQHTRAYGEAWLEDTHQVNLIANTTRIIRERAASLNELQSEMGELRAELRAVQGERYLYNFQQLKHRGQPVEALLLEADEALGGDAPAALRRPIETARRRFLQNPQISDFDRRFYAGDYAGALHVLGRQNDALPRPWRLFTVNDLMLLHDQALTDPARQKKDFPAGSFAAAKLREGFFAATRESAGGSKTYLLFRRQPSGALECYLADPLGEGGELVHKVISSEEQQSARWQTEQFQGNVLRVLQKSPAIAKAKDAAQVVQAQLSSLEQLFSGGKEGGRTGDFMAEAKRYAAELRGSSALSDLRGNLHDVQRELAALRELPSYFRDPFEKQIESLEQSLSGAARLVAEGDIQRLCDHILEGDYNESSLKEWFFREGVVLFSAIGGAVLTVVAVTNFWNPAGWAGMAGMAALGTAGGMAAAELGHAASESLGRSHHRADFENPSALGRYRRGDKLYNPETRAYETMDTADLGEIYGVQFVQGFVTTFATLGLGKVAGQFLRRFADANRESAHLLRGWAARTLDRLPRLRPQQLDLLSRKGGGLLLKRLGHELFEEFAQEGAQRAGEKIHPALGLMVSLYNALDGRRTEFTFGQFNVVAETVQPVRQQGNQITLETAYSYSAGDQAGFVGAAMRHYDRVTVSPDGEVVCEDSYTLKDGRTVNNRLVFRPSTESFAVRQLFAEGLLARDGHSTLERLYGVRATGELGVYECGSMIPDGKVSLAVYLKRHGFLVLSESRNEVVARQGNDVVTFRRPPPAVGRRVREQAALRRRRERREQALREASAPAPEAGTKPFDSSGSDAAAETQPPPSDDTVDSEAETLTQDLKSRDDLPADAEAVEPAPQPDLSVADPAISLASVRGLELASRLEPGADAEARHNLALLLDRMDDGQRVLAERIISSGIAPDYEPATLFAAILQHHFELSGLPETAGLTHAYYLPVAEGGMGRIADVFYLNAQGQPVRTLLKSAKNPSTQKIMDSQLPMLTAVAAMGPHAHVMSIPPDFMVRDAAGNIHLLVQRAGDMDGKQFVIEGLATSGFEQAEAVRYTEDLVFQTMDGLQHLWDHGFIHRDVKWPNVMVDTATGKLQLIDFDLLSAQPDPVNDHQRAVLEQNAKTIQDSKRTIALSLAVPGGMLKQPPVFRVMAIDMVDNFRFVREYDQFCVFVMITKAYEAFATNGSADALKSTKLGRMYDLAQQAYAAEKPSDIAGLYQKLLAIKAE